MSKPPLRRESERQAASAADTERHCFSVPETDAVTAVTAVYESD